MNLAHSKSNTSKPETATRAIPTFVATDLLEKLIADRDALAVRRVVTEGRRQ
jgi:hypothetical protein